MFKFCELSDLLDLSDMLFVIDRQYSGSVLQAAEAVLDSGICGRDTEFGVQFHVEGVQHICHEDELLHISVVNPLAILVRQLKTLFACFQFDV